ncbi:MAG TPA: disulfide bond formation protein B [Coxiellaceae bacterium]|nr:disulfide bond formation protein B [Coxiellaceae bacterium]
MMTKRRYFIVGFLFCLLALAGGFYLEHVFNFVPCALCVLQRVCLIVVALVFLSGSFRAPNQSSFLPLTAWVFSLAGGLLALRQVWLEHHLSGVNEGACLPGMTFLFKTLPFHKALWEAVKGSNECAQIHGTLFGLTLPTWSLGAFILLLLLSLRLLSRSLD